jgi:hypothetical protein
MTKPEVNRKFLTYPFVIDWLQWAEHPDKLGQIDGPQVALSLLAEYRKEYTDLQAENERLQIELTCAHESLGLKTKEWSHSFNERDNLKQLCGELAGALGIEAKFLALGGMLPIPEHIAKALKKARDAGVIE